MRVFTDSNVWVSTFAARGLCADLTRLLLRANRVGIVTLLTSGDVVRETERILTDKFGAQPADLVPVRKAMGAATMLQEYTAPLDAIPDPDDAPILAAALAGNADFFVTGDKPLLGLRRIEGMAIVTPRELYERLKGLR